MRPPSLEQPPWTSHDPDGPSETTAVDLRAKHRSKKTPSRLPSRLPKTPAFVMFFIVSMTSFFENQANQIFHIRWICLVILFTSTNSFAKIV